MQPAVIAGAGEEASDSVFTYETRGDHSAACRWSLRRSTARPRGAIYSRYFPVSNGLDCRLLVYPKGDSQSLPGYLSLYLQIVDPTSSKSSFDRFASYRLTVHHQNDSSKSVSRDSWHRFSSKKKSHGWCDFCLSSGFLEDEFIVMSAEILLLHETISLSPQDGKFTWRVHNFSLFRDMIKTQKIMSPIFLAGNSGPDSAGLRLSVYQSSVPESGPHLSLCLENREESNSNNKTSTTEGGCWCLFRMTVMNQRIGGCHISKDSYGRFGADGASLGWSDFMKMEDFVGANSGFLSSDGSAVFNVSFHVLKESCVFNNKGVMRKSDGGYFGKFTWRVEGFAKLKDILKKRKISGLCIKSRKFQVGNRDCRLIVYPRGQSQPPCHLSVFLEVTDPRNASPDWTCFVSHRLSVLNQRSEEKSITKESQNRYSKLAKDWGWREFLTLTSLFDQDSGFLVQDTVVFSAEVLVLKETSVLQEITNEPGSDACTGTTGTTKKSVFTWKVENFLSFKEIMESRKIFSKFFPAGGCELRIGVYESFDTVCIYLESDSPPASDPDRSNYWVRYSISVINQKSALRSVRRESSICTKNWNSSVLQFMKVSELVEPESGFLVKDTVIFVCEILDCCPWFEFSDLEVLASDDEPETDSTEPDEPVESESTEAEIEDEPFRNLLSRAGLSLSYTDNLSGPQFTLRDKILTDATAIAGFLSRLRVYLDHPSKVKRMLLPASDSMQNLNNDHSNSNGNSVSLISLLMGVSVLKQAIVDLLLDIMVECCEPSDRESRSGSGSCSSCSSSYSVSSYSVSAGDLSDRVERETGGSTNSSSNDSLRVSDPGLDRVVPDNKGFDGNPISPPETSAGGLEEEGFGESHKVNWPEQAEELLGLIVNSLRALDGAVPHGCPDPRRRGPHSVQKLALVLDKAPRHLRPDLVALVPKLIDQSDHPLAATALLDRLGNPDSEPSLRLPVLGALSQLEFGTEIWERVLLEGCDLLDSLTDESLAQAIGFVFKAGSHCQSLPRAAGTVRTRLKTLGPDISQCILDSLSDTVHADAEVAESLLSDMDSDPESLTSGPHDAYLLIDMLSVPSLFVPASQLFEKVLSSGPPDLASLSAVLQQRRNGIFRNLSEGEADDDFSSILSLCEVLSLSSELRVHDSVRGIYKVLFNVYTEERYRYRLVKCLVDRATNTCGGDICAEFEVLEGLVREEQGIVRPVLSLMRESAEVAQSDRASLWHQICSVEDENMRLREEREAEASGFELEREGLVQRLAESEATTSQLKMELKAENDRFAHERRDLREQIRELESQLEWVRSEKDEQVKKLSADRRSLQDRAHDAETQISQLKARKRDELKKLTKEKNGLAERVKREEMGKKRVEEELREMEKREGARRQALEEEARRLREAAGRAEAERREKEEQVKRCEAYIDAMEAKLNSFQQYIQNLESSLQEEMSRHAPLYGAGLDSLSLKELDTLKSIHEEGIRQIHSIQQRKTSVSPLVNIPQIVHGLYPSTSPPPQIAIGLPNSQIKGNVNGTIGPWYSKSLKKN